MSTQANMDSFDVCVHDVQTTGINRDMRDPKCLFPATLHKSERPPALVRKTAGKQKHCKVTIDYSRKVFVIVGGS